MILNLLISILKCCLVGNMNEEEKPQNQFLNNVEGTNNVENSDVVKHILFTLVKVASDKTSKDYAWSVVKNLLKELEETYDFLKFIRIGDLENLKNTIDDITVLSDLNRITPEELGKAIQNIIDVFRMCLGKKAGYFFIQELKNNLGEKYHLIIKKMGVDLRLSDLQNELSGLDSREYKIKDDRDSNIAFIERS